jgi:Fe2+ transport system protein B
MMDLAVHKGLLPDIKKLEQALGIKVIPAIVRQKTGIEEIKKAILHTIPFPENDIMPATTLAPELIQEIKQAFPCKK